MSPDPTGLPDADRRTVLKALGAGASGTALLPRSVTAQTSSLGDIVFEDEFEDGQLEWTDVDHPEFWSLRDGQVHYSPSTSAGSTGDNYLYADETFNGDEGLLEWPVALEFRAYASDTSAGVGAFATSGGAKDGRGTPRLGIQENARDTPLRVWNSEGQAFELSPSRDNNTWYTYRLVPDLENNEIHISRNDESWTIPEPNEDPIGNTSIALSGGTCWGCGGTGNRRYEYITVGSAGSSRPEEEAEEIVLSDFSTIEDQKQEVDGFPQQDSHHVINADLSGEYNIIHDIGVGFDGSMAYGSQCAFYNTFTPETSGEYKLWPRYTIQGESLIKQFEFLPGTARARNYVAVLSMIATAGDEWLEADHGERIPGGGDVLETNQRVVHDVAAPSGSDVLEDLSIEMATQLLESSGRLSATVASGLISALEITEILVEKGVKVDKGFGKNINVLPLSANLKAGTEYVVETSIIAISAVDLYKLEVDTKEEAINEALVAAAQAVQSLSGSFSRLDVEGEVQHVKVQPL